MNKMKIVKIIFAWSIVFVVIFAIYYGFKSGVNSGEYELNKECQKCPNNYGLAIVKIKGGISKKVISLKITNFSADSFRFVPNEDLGRIFFNFKEIKEVGLEYDKKIKISNNEILQNSILFEGFEAKQLDLEVEEFNIIKGHTFSLIGKKSNSDTILWEIPNIKID